jgi:hypothetical protein
MQEVVAPAVNQAHGRCQPAARASRALAMGVDSDVLDDRGSGDVRAETRRRGREHRDLLEVSICQGEVIFAIAVDKPEDARAALSEIVG